jgi:hypothetical protein
MLGAAILSAELRAEFSRAAIICGVMVFVVAVAAASVLHHKIRSHEGAQLAATAGLGLAGAPVEWAGSLPPSAVLASTLARLAVFLASTFLVRAAFARSARRPSWSSARWQSAALLLLGVAFVALTTAERPVEARACAVAGVACLALAGWRPTAKQLKPLGLSLAGVALASALALAL